MVPGERGRVALPALPALGGAPGGVLGRVVEVEGVLVLSGGGGIEMSAPSSMFQSTRQQILLSRSGYMMPLPKELLRTVPAIGGGLDDLLAAVLEVVDGFVLTYP